MNAMNIRFMKCAVVAAMMALSVGCKTGDFTYTGPDYLMFADTMYQYGVQQTNEVFNVPVSATRSASYDRTFGVEILDRESNAVEGRHFRLLASTVTIPAGELSVDVPVQGIYENIGNTDSLGFALNLVIPESEQWDHYGTRTKVVMQKICPFDIHNYTGYCKVTSTFFSSDFVQNVTMRLITSDVVEGKENTIVLHDLFYDGYDIEISLDTEDVMQPIVEMEEQVCGATGEVIGSLFGDGKVMMYQPTNYISYYNNCEKFVLQYVTMIVRNRDGSIYGALGTFVNILEWISDAEAEKLKEQGY
ncbi:MAG: DUF4984 domain-containing protein [Alistipes sp.]|nr:DUF4984 domain-containing protein [Alistipes sp.]